LARSIIHHLFIQPKYVTTWYWSLLQFIDPTCLVVEHSVSESMYLLSILEELSEFNSLEKATIVQQVVISALKYNLHSTECLGFL